MSTWVIIPAIYLSVACVLGWIGCMTLSGKDLHSVGIEPTVGNRIALVASVMFLTPFVLIGLLLERITGGGK